MKYGMNMLLWTDDCTGQKFPPIFERLKAMGYDSVRFLGTALSRGKANRPEEVRQAVSGLRGYDGVTGLKGFNAEREADVDPILLTVEGGVIKEAK